MYYIIVNNHFQFPQFDQQKFDRKDCFYWLTANKGGLISKY